MYKYINLLVFVIFTILRPAGADNTITQQSVQEWRQVVQTLLTGLSAGPFNSNFTPSFLAQRDVANALNNQINRWRGRVALSMTQAVGTSVSVCPPLDICDMAIQHVKEELETKGFDIQWQMYDSKDPIYFCPNGAKMICNGGRSVFRIKVPLN